MRLSWVAAHHCLLRDRFSVAVEDGRPPQSEETAWVLLPVDFVADRGGCNSDSHRVSGFGTASATPLIERSTAPSPSTAAELSPQICSWGLEKTPAPGGPTPPQSGRSPRPLVAERAAPAPSDMMRTSQD